MSELIIRADAENAYQTGCEEGFHAGYQQAMSEKPEIILCKDCEMCKKKMGYKGNRIGNPTETIYLCYGSRRGGTTTPDGFCNEGKRKV